MTAWKLTVRTSPGSLIAAEYECPVHGRFAVDVPRDASGDPPSSVWCLVAVDVCTECDAPADHCADCGAPASQAHTPGCDEPPIGSCGRTSPHVISAPGIARVRKVEAVRGGYQRPEFSTWTDTTNLGEGQDLDDWKADRAKVWARENERQAMELAREL